MTPFTEPVSGDAADFSRGKDSSHLTGALFWFMILGGAVILAPCLILPAWLEYQAALALRVRYEQQLEHRQTEIAKLRKQRNHLEKDDAYVLRLAHEQLKIEIPGVQRIPVEPSALPHGTAAPTEPAVSCEDELAPELSAIIEDVILRYPLVSMFVRPETRPSLLLIGSGLILTAIILLGTPAVVRRSRLAMRSEL